MQIIVVLTSRPEQFQALHRPTIAAIFAAAMSASGGELNALATATIIDFYRRHFVKGATDTH